MGAALGAQWLCEEHPEKVRSDLVVNEGGGVSFELEGRRLYTLCVGEKGVFRFNLRTRGRAGHASVPALGDNALLKLAPLLERLRSQPDREPTPEGLEFLGAILGEPVDAEGLDSALDRLAELDPLLAAFVAEPMLRVTLTPTKASASEKENVIPSHAEILVDCRVPPEMTSRRSGSGSSACSRAPASSRSSSSSTWSATAPRASRRSPTRSRRRSTRSTLARASSQS